MLPYKLGRIWGAILLAFSLPLSAQQNEITLYGPEPRFNHALEYYRYQWDFPGDALTASTEFVRFDLLPPVREATLLWVVWPLDRCWINIVHFNGGPTDIVGIGMATHHNSGFPEVIGLDVTDKINALIAAGIPKHIGYRLHGHCVTSLVRLRLVH